MTAAAAVTRVPISHLMTFSRHLEQFDDEMLVFIDFSFKGTLDNNL